MFRKRLQSGHLGERGNSARKGTKGGGKESCAWEKGLRGRVDGGGGGA